MRIRSLSAITLTAAVALLLSDSQAPGRQKQQEVIKIGVAKSMFRDLSDAKADTLIPEFVGLMFDQTGLKGEIVKAGDAGDLGKKLNDKEVHLAVFQGFEFAWARKSHPELKPLLIAIQRQRNLKACVVVLKDSKATSLADLKGKVLSIPSRCPEHCHLFLERELTAMEVNPKDFFAKIEQHPNAEDALDDILREKVHAVLVDGISLDVYDQVNPGRHARLKILKQADGFPQAVLAYREGGLEDALVAKVKKGMVEANTTTRGKEQLALWKLSGFESVPADFETMLADILKRYPPKAK